MLLQLLLCLFRRDIRFSSVDNESRLRRNGWGCAHPTSWRRVPDRLAGTGPCLAMTYKEGLGMPILSTIMTSGPRSNNSNHFLNRYELTVSSEIAHFGLSKGYSHTHLHTRLLVHTHTHTRARAFIRTHTHTFIRTHIHTHTHARARGFIRTNTRTHTHTHARLFVHTHTHTHARTHTRTDRTHAHTRLFINTNIAHIARAHTHFVNNNKKFNCLLLLFVLFTIVYH